VTVVELWRGERAAAVVLTSWQDRLVLGWTGSDLHLNVASSPDGRVFGDKRRLKPRSYVRVSDGDDWRTIPLRPAVAGAGGLLHVAWTAPNGKLNLTPVDGAPGRAESPAMVHRQRSASAPALAASGRDDLVLAWTGTDRHVNLLTLAGPRTGAPVWLRDARTDASPAVCRHGDAMVVAWTGGDRRINLMTVSAGGPAQPLRLEQARSPAGPALCSHRGRLVLAWAGGDRRVNLLTVAGDQVGSHIRLDEAKTVAAPAVCSHDGAVVVAWVGTDRRVNVVRP
jgi:hypothetical protein